MKRILINPENGSNTKGLYILGSLYPDVTGGMEIFNYYFLNYQLNESSDEIYYIGEKKARNENGNFIHIKRRWPVRIFYPFQLLKAVYKLRNRIDYAYISYAEQSWIISFSNSLVLRFFKIPYIITIHWGKEPDWKFKYPFIYYFRHARAVIGVSEPVCAAFKKTIPDQEFQYVPPLIPFSQATEHKSDLKKKLGYLKEEKLVLFVGSMKPMKNPDKIIQAFQKIGSTWLEEQNIRLVLVGTGEMSNLLKDMIDKYQLGKYIRMEGLVHRDSIPDYYKASDLYIISSDYEGTSLSLMEAMYNSLVIIGSDAPGINKMLKNEQNSLLYETHNTDQLAKTIIQAFSDQVFAKSLAERAFKDFNLQYSYESMMKRYQAIFSSVSI
jgi:glycosyltransferase involved in cell wall biosynthesis